MAHLAYVSLGSNVGDREKNLRSAIQALRLIGRVRSISSFYETEPVEFTKQPEFLNCVVALETPSTPAHLLHQLLDIEKAMGRQRIQKKGPRTIDLDVVLFGDVAINTPEVIIPHPAMHQRRFVLEPLAEIAPEARHPILKKTVGELLKQLPEGQSVRRIEANSNVGRRS
ncbi:MAG TPA: 2-amino-4-hydroxy-6-hydroxymethyldihydropteridine diphosphokinase [Dongiaceae bacterium]|nr:2-amino-4-hydroxy-6-hydroxymethyldihydropteridine diphosphokinase [Dongiaceae bacterium]